MSEWPKTEWKYDKYSGWLLSVTRSAHSNVTVMVHIGDTKEHAIKTLETALKQLKEQAHE